MAGLGRAASGLPAAWSAWPAALGSLLAAARPDTVGKEQESHGRKPAPAPGPAPAAAAPDGGGADMGVLAERLAALEQRVAALEGNVGRSEEHTSELQSLMRNSYAVFCLKKKMTTIRY